MKVPEMENRPLLPKPEAVSEALSALYRAFGQQSVARRRAGVGRVLPTGVGVVSGGGGTALAGGSA